MPAPRRFTAMLPERARPSLGRRVLRAVLFVSATLALTRVAWCTFRVPSEPVRSERVIRVQ